MNASPQTCTPSGTRARTIAHRAGNSRAGLRKAIQAGVDWIEADVWWQYGRLDARHEHTIWRLPLRYDEWKLGIALRRPLSLPEICELTAGSPQILVDLKGTSRRLPAGVVETLRTHRVVDRAAICGQVWPLLDAAVTIEPSLRAFYSLGSEQQLGMLRSRPAGLPRITAVSCAEFLLRPPVISELIERGITIFAWTVNGIGRALELVDQAVAGIISDSYEVLAAIEGPAGAAENALAPAAILGT